MTLTPPPSATTGGLIDCHGVAKSFGATVALSNVTMSVPKGVTGLLGSNGAGKTTIMGLILGLQPRTAGSMLVLGEDPQTAGPDIRGRIGYSPEHHHLPEDVQASDLVRHLAQLHGLPRQASTERASDALWQVGLGEERFRPIGTMSTGQRQRVKLAAAIAHDPDLVLLDEPTDGLDPVQRDDMLHLIRRIGTDFGIDIVLSSHLLDEVERVCDNVIILAGGIVTKTAALGDIAGEVTGLLLEVDEAADRVAMALSSRGCHVAADGEKLVVTGEGDLHLFIRDAVAEVGVGLRRLGPQQRNLEDVFFDANAPAPTGAPVSTMPPPPGAVQQGPSQ